MMWVQRFHDLVTVSGLGRVRAKDLVRALLAQADDDVMEPEFFATGLASLVPRETLRRQFSAHSDHTVGSALMTIYDAFGIYAGEVSSCRGSAASAPRC